MNQSIRWRQRFQNLQKAHQTLKEGVAIENPNIFEQQGIIQCFEFTFELSWKTVKDFLESKQVEVPYPRDTIKQTFAHNIILDGELWMEMLEQRNLMAQTYNDQKAKCALTKIRSSYFPTISQVVSFFSQQKWYFFYR